MTKLRVNKIGAMLVTVCTVLFLSACSSDSANFESGMTEGEIEYQVTYPEIDSNSLVLSMLPSTVTLVFKDNKLKTNFSAAAGMFELNVISDGNNHTLVNTVKLFGDRYALTTDANSSFRIGKSLPPFTVTNGTETANVAQLDCSTLNVEFAGMGLNKFAVTDEIGIQDPNWFTVYSDVESFLMEYTIEQYDILMHLKAIRIEQKEISDDEFIVDERCKPLTEKEFDELIISNLKVMMEDF